MRYQKFISEASAPLWSHFEDADCKGDFSFNFEFERAEDRVKLMIDPIIVSSFLKKQLKSRKIRLVMSLSCRATYQYSDISIGYKGRQSIELKTDDFFGKVYLTMVAYNGQKELEIDKKELQGIFEGASLKIAPGTIIAVSNEEFIDFNQAPKPLDVSFFALALSDEMAANEFKVVAGDTRVTIVAGSTCYKQLIANRNNGYLDRCSTFLPCTFRHF